MRSSISALCILLCLFISCALPGGTRIPDAYVSEKEIETVSAYREGLHYFRLGRYQDAERAMFHALQLAPDSPHIKLNLALTLVESGDIERAQMFLDDVELNEKNQNEYVRVKIRFLKKEYEYTEAIHFIREWLLKLDDGSQENPGRKRGARKHAVDENSDTEKEARAKERDELNRFIQSLKIELASILFTVGREHEAACVVHELLDTPVIADPMFAEYIRYALALGNYHHVIRWISIHGKNSKFLHDMRMLYYQSLASLGVGKTEDAEKVLRTAFALEAPSPTVYQGVLFVRNYFLSKAHDPEEEPLEDYLESLPIVFGGTPLSSPEAFLWPVELLSFGELMQSLKEDEEDS